MKRMKRRKRMGRMKRMKRRERMGRMKRMMANGLGLLRRSLEHVEVE